MFFITMSILQLPYSLVISVFIAFMALIPYVGAFLGCVVGALLIVIVSPMKALIFIITFFVLQQLEGQLIYPKVVGSSVGLPAIWILVSVFVGGKLFGIVGMLFFIPLASVLYSLLRLNVNHRLEKRAPFRDGGGGAGDGKRRCLAQYSRFHPPGFMQPRGIAVFFETPDRSSPSPMPLNYTEGRGDADGKLETVEPCGVDGGDPGGGVGSFERRTNSGDAVHRGLSGAAGGLFRLEDCPDYGFTRRLFR